MHGCAEDEEVADSDMIVADFLEPIGGDCEESKIRYRSLPNGVGGEELIIQDDSVTLREYPSGVVQRRLSADFALLDAFWCQFPNTSANDNGMRGVCLIGRRNLIFAPDTDWLSYTITLPFTVKSVFRCALGLILQRASSLPSQIGTVNFPHLFSLSHPYSEILPVICKNKDADNSSHYIWDSTEVVLLGSLDECQLLLTYSTTTRVHSLYWVRKATKTEWKCAASKAESVVSLSTTLTPIGRNSQFSTPQMGSQPRTRFGRNDSFADDAWSTPQTRSVRTRSMTAAAALIQSLPFPTTSPIQRSSVNRSITDSPIFRLRGGSLHTTPRINSFCEESIISLIETRGSEIDLLAPEVCIECVWTERRQADPEANSPASTAFVTQDFIGQMYACFYVAEQKLLKCIRVKVHDEGRVTTSSFTTIQCQGAVNIEGRKMMALIDLDGTVILYSGITRVGALYGNYDFPVPKESPTSPQKFSAQPHFTCGISMCAPIFALHTAFMGHIILETHRHEFVLCKLPSPSFSPFVAECLSQVCSNVPLDKAMKLSTSWSTGNSSRLLERYQGNRVAAEVAMFVQFVFSQCGLHIQEFPIFREIGLLRICCEEGICEKKKRTQNLSRADYSLAAFSGLHAAYDLAKLDRRTASLLFILASSLHAFAQIFELKSYSDYYRKDFPTLSKQSFTILEDGRNVVQALLMSARFSPERIPSWLDNLLRFLDNRSHLSSITSSHFFAPIVIIVAVGLKRLNTIADVQKVLGKSFEKKLHLSKEDVEQFDDILSENCTPIEKCEKLAQLFKFTKSSLLDLPPAVALILCELLYERATKTLHFLSPSAYTKDRSCLPSLEENFAISRRRWKQDLRLINAIQMLDSRRPVFIPTSAEALPEAEQRELCEQLLHSISMRTVTHAFGRSAIDFRSFSPPLSRPRSVPPLNLQGRQHPANTPFELTQNDGVKLMVKWGSFYNAVAAGLCLGDVESLHLDCEWLAMSINNQQGPEAAGLMYAFGLNGHIANMNLFMIHELLSTGDTLMSIAILLGYAVSRRATADVQMYKMMITHLPFMMGPTLLELHIDTMIQTAALVALGLVFAQSSHLGILGQLVNEIGRPASPDREPPADRYSYTLAAGFAFGLIALGRGEDLMSSVPFAEHYPPLASRILVLMEGGLRSLCVFSTASSATECPPSGQTAQAVGAAAPQLSNHVLESETVNPHLTAASATIAFGFMYLRTEDRWAAECLKIPDTLSAIEAIRPDLILLRTLCRHLILWDEIRASRQWVEESVPAIVLNYKERLFSAQGDSYIGRTLRRAVDRETIAQTYLYSIAGACFALALRFASTWNAEAFNTIMQYALMLLPGESPDEPTNQLRVSAKGAVSFTVFNTLVNSLGILMAGSGNLEVLRLCRLLRTAMIPFTYRESTSHGVFHSSNTAIGMLMMGRGRYALKTDDLSVACLVMSFFPISPHSIVDNRTYLQPLRLLWVIAAEERLLCSIDADNEELVELDVQVTFKGTKATVPDVLNLRTPCILPELSLLDKVQIGGQEYEKRIYNLLNESDKEQLDEILRKHHGRMIVNYLGRREQKVVVATLKRLCDTVGDPILRPLREQDLLKVGHEEQQIREQFNLELLAEASTSASSGSDVRQKLDAAAYDSWIRRFQLENGSIAAHDYALSFVKEMLHNDPLHFPRAQYQVLGAFLDRKSDQTDEWPLRSNVIPSELVASLT